VLDALGGGSDLSKYIPIPKALTEAQAKPRRFFDCVVPEGIAGYVREWLDM
jgi:hypothetical protein